MEKHFLQIYNWYVPMVQMEKKIRADLPLVRTDGTNEKSFLTELPLVRTDGTKWKNFLNFCPKITKKWLKIATSGQKI